MVEGEPKAWWIILCNRSRKFFQWTIVPQGPVKMPEYDANYNKLGGSKALTLCVKPALAHAGTSCSHVPFRLFARFVVCVKFMLLASTWVLREKKLLKVKYHQEQPTWGACPWVHLVARMAMLT